MRISEEGLNMAWLEIVYGRLATAHRFDLEDPMGEDFEFDIERND